MGAVARTPHRTVGIGGWRRRAAFSSTHIQLNTYTHTHTHTIFIEGNRWPVKRPRPLPPQLKNARFLVVAPKIQFRRADFN